MCSLLSEPPFLLSFLSLPAETHTVFLQLLERPCVPPFTLQLEEMVVLVSVCAGRGGGKVLCHLCEVEGGERVQRPVVRGDTGVPVTHLTLLFFAGVCNACACVVKTWQIIAAFMGWGRAASRESFSLVSFSSLVRGRRRTLWGWLV